MIYVHGWYNAAYQWSREQGLGRKAWTHVPHGKAYPALVGVPQGARFVCVYGWEFDVMVSAQDRGHEVEIADEAGPPFGIFLDPPETPIG